MQGQDVALCVGSDLNFATRCKSLGIKNGNSSGTLGLHMHTTLVATVCRSPAYDAPDGTKNKLPEETQRTGAAGLTCRRTRRHAGGDGKAISCSPFSANSGMLLVRAKHDRKLGKDLPKLFDKVRAEPVRQRLEILPPVTVPVARKPKTDGRPATHGSPCAGAWWISRRPHGRRSRLRWFMSKKRKIRAARRGSC